MTYQSGFLRARITIRNKKEGAGFGDTTEYENVANLWASATFQRGMKQLREGSLDNIDAVMFRMRFNDIVTRDSHIIYDNREFLIKSLHRDKHENIIQITATEII